jgi:hypothetical protein
MNIDPLQAKLVLLEQMVEQLSSQVKTLSHQTGVATLGEAAKSVHDKERTKLLADLDQQIQQLDRLIEILEQEKDKN